MLFGVNNHYNNNSTVLGAFDHACLPFLFPEASVLVTNRGLTIFNLDKTCSVASKLNMARSVNDFLLKTFGNGLSFAVCASEMCVPAHELVPFFDGIRRIAQPMTTVYIASRECDGNAAFRDDLRVDHTLDPYENIADRLVSILNPTAQDKAEPSGGWEAFEARLLQFMKNLSPS